MSTISCPHCAAPNRSNAKFCRSCAKQMVNLETNELLQGKRRRSKRRTPAQRSSRSIQRLLLPAAALLLTAGLGFWLLHGDTPPAPTPVATPRLATSTASADAPTLNTPPLLVDKLSPASTPAALPPPTSPQPASQSPDANSRARASTAPSSAARLAHTSSSPAAANAPRAAASPVTPTPPTRPSAASVPASISPQQACQNTSFLKKAACLQRECDRTPNHAQCKRMREEQEALRQASGGG